MDFNPIINAVNDHFGLNPKWGEFMLMTPNDYFTLPTPDDYDDEFMLFDKPIEIVSQNVAWDNIVEFYGENHAMKYSDNNNIDYYRRLGNSNYFFRWL